MYLSRDHVRSPKAAKSPKLARFCTPATEFMMVSGSCPERNTRIPALAPLAQSRPISREMMG